MCCTACIACLWTSWHGIYPTTFAMSRHLQKKKHLVNLFFIRFAINMCFGEVIGGENSCCHYSISTNTHLTPRGILKMFHNDHFMWKFCMLMSWLTRNLPCALVLGWTNSWAIQVSVTNFVTVTPVRILVSNSLKKMSSALLYMIPPY